MKVAVFASHEGSTLQAILDASRAGRLPRVELALVISNNADSGALRRAAEAGVPATLLSGRTHPDPQRLDEAIEDALVQHGIELVVLAGYMKKLGPRVLTAYARRIINTHPALLPKYGGKGMYGLHVHRAVIEARETVSGASVHWVEAEYDTGPVLAQVTVPVEPSDTPEVLAERVKASERDLLVHTLDRLSRKGLACP